MTFEVDLFSLGKFSNISDISLKKATTALKIVASVFLRKPNQ